MNENVFTLEALLEYKDWEFNSSSEFNELIEKIRNLSQSYHDSYGESWELFDSGINIMLNGIGYGDTHTLNSVINFFEFASNEVQGRQGYSRENKEELKKEILAINRSQANQRVDELSEGQKVRLFYKNELDLEELSLDPEALKFNS